MPVAAKPDAFLQVIERQQMVFPLAVHHVQNDSALQPAHQIRRELLFFVLVFLCNRFGNRVRKLIVIQRSRISASGLRVSAELAVHFGEKLRDIPLAWVQLTPAIRVDKFPCNIFGDSDDVVALILAFQR